MGRLQRGGRGYMTFDGRDHTDGSEAVVVGGEKERSVRTGLPVTPKISQRTVAAVGSAKRSAQGFGR